MDKPLLGATFALLAALVWSFAVILFKRSGEKVAPLSLNLFKNTVALTLLAISLIVMGEGFDVRKPPEVCRCFGGAGTHFDQRCPDGHAQYDTPPSRRPLTS